MHITLTEKMRSRREGMFSWRRQFNKGAVTCVEDKPRFRYSLSQKKVNKKVLTNKKSHMKKSKKKQKWLDKDMKNKKNKIKIDVEVEFTWVLLETKKIAYEKYLKNNDPGKIEN